MMQRTVTGLSLTALLAVPMYFGGAVMGIAALICICFAVHEEYGALTLAGHRPIAWPTWVGMIVALPLTLTVGTKGYEKRSVERAQNERVFNGPHEGFVENLRTNITLLRRIVVSPRMVTEMISVGKGIPTQAAVVYLDGVADEKAVLRVSHERSLIDRRRRAMLTDRKNVKESGGE